MVKHRIAVTVVTLMLLPLTSDSAYAETFSISGNGMSSSNDVINSTNTSTTVNQNNTTNTNNNTTSFNLDTGDNAVSGTTGDSAAINTGDIFAGNTIMNSGSVNASTIDDCCSKNVDVDEAVISGNGSHSDNGITSNSSNVTRIDATNDTSITNIINGTAITGNNTANRNNSDVVIETGDISVRDEIHTIVNNNQVKIGRDKNGKIVLKINGNGTDSKNTINYHEDNDLLVGLDNDADIFNKTILDLMTGNNSANDNNDDVMIKTGDVDMDLLARNNSNQNIVTIDCDCEEEVAAQEQEENEQEEKANPIEEQKERPATTVKEEKPTQGGGRQGQVLAAHFEYLLPVTGNPWVVLAILGNAIMLFFGMLLRLRSGRSPSTVAAL